MGNEKETRRAVDGVGTVDDHRTGSRLALGRILETRFPYKRYLTPAGHKENGKDG